MSEQIKRELLDVTGHKCPIPVLRLRKYLENLETGEKITLIASDPMAELDIAHFCHKAGHNLMNITKEGAKIVFQIKK